MTTRIFDILLAGVALILLFPILLTIWVLIKVGSKGGGFYIQSRIGKNGIPFKLIKFRTMKTGSDKKGLLTVGNDDSRITNIGRFLRKHKLDELPQLVNVLLGEMSFVGPRPEVRKYVDLYTEDQRTILKVKPGITDYASIVYNNENEILAAAKNPEEEYITVIMPHKIELNRQFINDPSLKNYFKIIFLTILKFLPSKQKSKLRSAIALACICLSGANVYSQSDFEALLDRKIDSLSDPAYAHYWTKKLYPNDASIGLMIPTGWGGYGTFVFGGIGAAYPQVYSKNQVDFGSGAGFCIGNPETGVNFSAGVNMNDLSKFNNFSANFGISRSIGIGSSISAGVLGLFASKIQSDAPEASYYVAFSHSLQSIPSKVPRSSKLSFTIGVGNGRFLLKSEQDSIAGKGKFGTAVFGGISYEILPHINLNAEWTGLNLGLSLGARPFKMPLSIGIGVMNLTKYTSDQPNLIFSVGYAISLNKYSST